MSPTHHLTSLALTCFPRVSGDEPVTPMLMLSDPTFSPRERG